jgi:hypothetical protein
MWKMLTMRVPMLPELDHASAIEQVCLGDTPISSVFPMIDAVR